MPFRLKSATARMHLLSPWLWCTFAAHAQVVYKANPVAEFRLDGDRPLRMPTVVDVASDGRVYVADGVWNRVIIFRPDGSLEREISTIGALQLDQPLAVRVDNSGNVWIADTGNCRIVSLPADGSPPRVYRPPTAHDGETADVTDFALTPDGRSLWAADNNGHRILRLDFDSSNWQSFGQYGEGLGDFQYPYSLIVTDTGDVLVNDVINTRIQVLNSRGTAVSSIGSYGVDLGELYRPKGLALDSKGRLWISDGVTGTIQIFTQAGDWIDVLHDAESRIMHFDSPHGIDFDAAGNLYVVELGAGRVRKLAITNTGAAPRRLPPRRERTAGEPSQARSCTICHIEWMPPFADNRDTVLMPRPVAAPDDPPVARPEACLSCHDGSVVDSRRRVWSEHGHLTGVVPPQEMKVPTHLPLINGKLACRTCHSAHGGGAAQADISRAVFLRVPNQAGELCVSCHIDKTRGTALGSHPTGGMPWPVPQTLIDAGARVGPNPRELTCQVCHTPHGAHNDHLLVLGTSSNQLCMQCHEQMRPGMFRDGGHTEHPFSPGVNDEQRHAIESTGGKLGDAGQLICLSCHRLHSGKGDRFLLADDLKDGRLCLNCHSDRAAISGSSHDLRTNFPSERNRLGMTAESGGPCSACHLFHRYAREMTPGPNDPSGKCLTCHSDGKCAENRKLGSLTHPTLACLDCHDPHDTKHANFLPAPAEQVCIRCHSEQAEVVSGAHHASLDNPAWSKSGFAAADHCLACHRTHGTESTGLFRVAAPPRSEPSPDGASSSDAVCIACHPVADWGASGDHAAAHPRGASTRYFDASLPLVAAHDGSDPRIGCRTCHEPHAGESRKLLRASTGQELCLKCHSDMRHMMDTAHAPARLASRGFESDSCRPCHSVHANPASVERHLLWNRALLGSAGDTRPNQHPNSDTSFKADSTDDAHCTACHGPSGTAQVPAVATHPEVPLFDPFRNSAQTGIRIFSDIGLPDATGRITCRTCHLPHGREPPPDTEHTRAARLLLRPFLAPNVCTSCHGADALRRYLYFHDPQKRR